MTARYLLDTNVVSETRKRQPNANVAAFLARQTSRNIFVSVLTIGELRKGVKARRRPDPSTADALGSWVDGMEKTFQDRILPVNTRIARLWGELPADRSRQVVDTLLAATAITHGLVLVTRNTRDLAEFDVELLDPFAG